MNLNFSIIWGGTTSYGQRDVSVDQGCFGAFVGGDEFRCAGKRRSERNTTAVAQNFKEGLDFLKEAFGMHYQIVESARPRNELLSRWRDWSPSV